MTYSSIVEILLYSSFFANNKGAESFCHRFQTDGAHGKFVYRGKEFTVPDIPDTHQFVADISPSDDPDYPVKVDILITRKKV